MNKRHLLAGLRAIALASLLALSACASGRVLARPALFGADAASTAQVFVLRTSQIPGVAITVPVEIDGTAVADLGSGEYVQFQVAPGPHVISVAIPGREQTARLVAAPQARYFFEFHFEVFGSNGPDVLRSLASGEGDRKIASGSYRALSQ